MAMVLMNQLNFDVCDMINKVCIEDHKRQKIIDDYEIFINGIDDWSSGLVANLHLRDDSNYFYNLHVEIFYKNKRVTFTGSDKDDMFKKFQNVKDYMNLNIDDNIVSVKLLISRGFVDCDGIYCWVDNDEQPNKIDGYKVPNYDELIAIYDGGGGNCWDWDEDIFDEDEFITHYNEVKELYDNCEFYENGKDNDNIIFNKW